MKALACFFLALGALLARQAVAAEPPAAAPTPPAEAAATAEVAADVTAADSDPEAVAVLQSMAKHLAGLSSFSFDAKTSFDALQPDGRSIEFGENRKVSVRRPDRLRIETVASDGLETSAYYDGKKFTAWNADAKIYAQSEAGDTLDEAIFHFVNRLKMRLPLAAMLTSRIAEDLDRRLRALEYVELSTMCDVPCHHISGRTHTTDVEIWISAGDEPLPQRVLITYRDEPGRPQFRALLSNWRRNPELDDALFAFAPPEGAKGIPFAATVARKHDATKRGDQP